MLYLLRNMFHMNILVLCGKDEDGWFNLKIKI